MAASQRFVLGLLPCARDWPRSLRLRNQLHGRFGRSCRGRAQYSSLPATSPAQTLSRPAESVHIHGKNFATDSWFNVPPNVLAATSRRLHLQEDHPVAITRQIIEAQFPEPTFRYYNTLHPVVSTLQNFDSLGFPLGHPGRSRTDTYYINRDTLLRTHTSAHEAELFRAAESDGYLISADVYRRDEVDRTHYPVFHQMEGARVWDRTRVPSGNVANAILEDLARMPKHNIKVEDPNPPFHPERNPLQHQHHTDVEAVALGAHLKRSLELMVIDIFSRASAAARKTDPGHGQEPLRMRWVEAFFPFTSPSWELEVYYAGDWLEVLGCGITQHKILANAGQPDRLGWAFGIGLERIAMLLFQIHDIRLFWSTDKRFLSQFTGVSADLSKLAPFVPFSRHPACYKDVSFWLRSAPARTTGIASMALGGGADERPDEDVLALVRNLSSPTQADGSPDGFHDNDVMEVIRSVAGETVEDVQLVDDFTHPTTHRRSKCYRINYRSLERTLTNAETNDLHEEVRRVLVEKLGVEMR